MNRQVLAEVELAVDDVFSSTSDSGSDVKRLFVKVFPAHGWSWCISHLGNVALKEGFGAKEGSASKNPEARDLLKAIKKEVTHLSQSKMKVGKGFRGPCFSAEVCFKGPLTCLSTAKLEVL
jgi:hypothetical protein